MFHVGELDPKYVTQSLFFVKKYMHLNLVELVDLDVWMIMQFFLEHFYEFHFIKIIVIVKRQKYSHIM